MWPLSYAILKTKNIDKTISQLTPYSTLLLKYLRVSRIVKIFDAFTKHRFFIVLSQKAPLDAIEYEQGSTNFPKNLETATRFLLPDG
jgi:hypothetical protein